MTQLELETLVVKLTADVSNFVKGFQEVQTMTSGTVAHIQEASTTIDKLSTSVSTFAQTAAAGLATLGAVHWLHETTSVASGLEQQFIGLTAAIKFNTTDVDNSIDAYKRLSEQMFEATGTSKQTTMSLLQMAETQGITGKRAIDITKQAIALGAATGRSPHSLIPMLDMAQQGHIQMLRRIPALKGITNEVELQDKANKLMLVGMETAKAQMNSYAGVSRIFSEELEDVRKQFGKLLLEALKPGIEILTKIVQAFKDLDERTKLVILSIIGITAGVVSLVAAFNLLRGVIATAFSGTGTVLAVILPIAAGIALWVQYLGGVTAAWGLIKQKAQEFWDWIKPVAQATWDVIRIGAILVAQTAMAAWELIKVAFEPVKQFLIESWHLVGEAAEWAADQMEVVWEPLVTAATAYAVTLAGIVLLFTDVLPTAIRELIPVVQEFIGDLVDSVPDALDTVGVVSDEVFSALVTALESIRIASSSALDVLKDVGSWIGDKLSGIPQLLHNIADFIQRIPPIIEGIARETADFFEILVNVAEAFKWINDKISIAVNWVTSLAASFQGTLSSGIGKAMAYAESLALKIVLIAAALYSVGVGVVAAWGPIMAAGSALVARVVVLYTWITGIGIKISLLISLVTVLAIKFEYVWASLLKLKEFFQNGAVNDWLMNVAEGIGSFFGWVGGAISRAWTTVVDALTFEKIRGYLDSIGQGVSSLLDLIDNYGVTVTFWTVRIILLGAAWYKMGWQIGVVTGLLEVFGRSLVPVAVLLVTSFAGAGTKVAFLASMITVLAAKTDYVSKALTWIKELFQSLASSTNWIQSITDKMAGFLRVVADAAGPAIQFIKNQFSAMWESAVEAFNLIASAASEAFGVISAVAGEAFGAIGEILSNFTWNLQNAVTVIAVAVGVVAAMATFLLAWATAAKVVTLITALMTVVMIPQKLIMVALNALWALSSILVTLLGAKLIFSTAMLIMYKIGATLAAIAQFSFNLAVMAGIVLIPLFIAGLVLLAAVLTGTLYVAIALVTSAAATLARTFIQLSSGGGWIIGMSDAFRHWRDVLGGLVTAVRVDMAAAWKYVEQVMHLAAAEMDAYWPPIWSRLKVGFTALWEYVAATFKIKMIEALRGLEPYIPGLDAGKLGRAQLDNIRKLTEAKEKLNTAQALDLSAITTPELEAEKARTAKMIANVNTLAELKAAAEKANEAAAEKHKKELDTQARLNILTQQQVELKKAELVLANSAEAIFRIQAYRVANQAALEARAARERKEALDKGPGKTPEQIRYETGRGAFDQGLNVLNVVSAPVEALVRAVRVREALMKEYKEALHNSTTGSERNRVTEKYFPLTVEANSNQAAAYAKLNPEGSDNSIKTLLEQIRDALIADNKNPTIEMRPAGLR